MSGTSQTRQPLSVYSVMLIVSAILMLVASILMAIEMSFWSPPGKTQAFRPPPVRSNTSLSQHFPLVLKCRRQSPKGTISQSQ